MPIGAHQTANPRPSRTFTVRTQSQKQKQAAPHKTSQHDAKNREKIPDLFYHFTGTHPRSKRNRPHQKVEPIRKVQIKAAST